MVGTCGFTARAVRAYRTGTIRGHIMGRALTAVPLSCTNPHLPGNGPPPGGTPGARDAPMTDRPTSTSMIPAGGFPAACSLAARA